MRFKTPALVFLKTTPPASPKPAAVLLIRELVHFLEILWWMVVEGSFTKPAEDDEDILSEDDATATRLVSEVCCCCWWCCWWCCWFSCWCCISITFRDFLPFPPALPGLLPLLVVRTPILRKRDLADLSEIDFLGFSLIIGAKESVKSLEQLGWDAAE